MDLLTSGEWLDTAGLALQVAAELERLQIGKCQQARPRLRLPLAVLVFRDHESAESTDMPLPRAAKYEATQNLNAITRFLHSFRFRNLADVFSELAQQIPDRPIEVLELGCGIGKAYEAISGRFRIRYRGVDIDEEMILTARERYGHDGTCEFVCADAADPKFFQPDSADIVIALETFEHIPENVVVRIVENIAHIVRPRLFVVSVPIEIGPAIWVKFIGAKLMGYSARGPGYTWSYAWWAGLYSLNKLPPHGVRHLGFNWYWLEQTIRHNAPIRESRSMPFRLLPKWIAPSVMFIAEPRATPTTKAAA